MKDITKMDKEEYVNYVMSLVDLDAVKQTWEEFKLQFKEENKRQPDIWLDFMELDDADLSDISILSTLDKNFHERVYKNPTIINEEVFDKVDKKVSGVIPDHIQLDIEGGTGVGKSTLMLAINKLLFPKFSATDIFFMKKHLLDYVSENHEFSFRSVKVLDEDVKSKGIGSGRTDDDLSQLFESCRKAGLSYCGCHAIAKHENQTVYYRFLVFCKSVKRRITCCAVYRMNVCIGFVIVRIPYSKDFFELEWEYNKKKDAFIVSTMKNNNSETLDLTKCANKVLELPECIKLATLGKLNKKTLKTHIYELYNNYTTSEQDLILSKAYIIYLSKETGTPIIEDKDGQIA